MNSKRKRRLERFADAKEQKVITHPAAINLLVDSTWEFAHSQLWPYRSFTELEVSVSKEHIKGYYVEIPSEQFSENAACYMAAYSERILIAKRHARKFGSIIPHPWIWLDRRNPKGIKSTRKLYVKKIVRRYKKRSCVNQSLNPLLFLFPFRPVI
jgi:hypothetical protein